MTMQESCASNHFREHNHFMCLTTVSALHAIFDKLYQKNSNFHIENSKMSSVPELKKKKIARDAELAKKAAAAATKAVADAAADEKAFYAKAQKYEAEYEQVEFNASSI